MTTETQAAPEAAPAAETPAAPETPETYTPTTVDERVAALKAKGDDKKAEAAPAPEVDEAAKAREERNARLKALQDREREAQAKRLARKQQERERQPPPPDPKLQTRLAELESFEKALQDEDAFLSLAEQRGIKPEKLGAWIRDRLQNPERIAAETAKKALSPVEERMKGEIAELRQQLLHLSQSREMDQMAQVEAQAGRMLLERTGNTQRTAPYAHRYLQRHGEEAYLQFARSVASSLPEGSGLEAIHDSIEAALESLQLGEPSAPSQQKPTQSAPARATTNTVTNSLASKRTAVADDETSFALLPFEERLRLVKQKHG